MNNRCMMPGQIFVYTLALIIVSLILVFGYKIIVGFIGDSSKVEHLQFEKNVEGLIKGTSTEYGTIRIGDIPAPGNVKTVCFVDYNWDATNLVKCDSATKDYAFIKDSFGSIQAEREKKNVFLIGPKDDFVDSYYSGNITVKPVTPVPGGCNLLCIQSERGLINFRVKGRGDHAEISDLSTTP